MTPSGKKPERVWGLAKIARVLGVGLTTLKRWLELPAGERPPVRRCHRGYYAFVSRLQDWVDTQDEDAGSYLARQRQRQRRPQSRTARAA